MRASSAPFRSTIATEMVKSSQQVMKFFLGPKWIASKLQGPTLFGPSLSP